MADSNSRAISSHPISLLHIPSCAKTLLIWPFYILLIPPTSYFGHISYNLQTINSRLPHSLTGTVCILFLLPHYHTNSRFRHHSFLIWRCGKNCIETWLCRQITSTSQFDAASVVIKVVKPGTCKPRNDDHANRKASLAARYLISNKEGWYPPLDRMI